MAWWSSSRWLVAGTGNAPRTAGVAFGLALDAGYAVPGVTGIEAPLKPPRPSVRLDLTGEAQLIETAGRPEQRISDRPGMSIDASRHGYTFRTSGYGAHWISASGDRVLSAPPGGMEEWRWQRVLVGQLLPFCAVLRGFEAIHASAVVVDGRALAIVGRPGAGKSTLAMHLVLAGAGFLTDDVLALTVRDGVVDAEPGAGLTSIRHTAGGLGSLVAEQGRRLGSDEDAERIAIPTETAAVPLGAVCFLDRDSSATCLRVGPLSPVDPRLLLGATFNLVLRSPERLARQLDISARMGRGPVLKATIPPGGHPAEAAAQIVASVRREWSRS